jgi:large repetitive protein
VKPRIGLSLLLLMALWTGALWAQIPPLTITTTALANGTVGVFYSQTLTATGAYGNYSWTVVEGALPAGLTLSPSGVISGTPSEVGSYFAQVRVSSPLPTSGVVLADRQFTLVISAPPLSITTTSIPNGMVGVAYSANLAATGGILPYGWSIVQSFLPSGLTQDATSGTISGTPKADGTFSFVVRVMDAQEVVATRGYSVTILAAVKITTASPLPSGTVGSVYSQQLAATGGTPPYTWTAPNGNLPPGLNMEASSGLLKGSPTTAGTFNFSLAATDQNGYRDTVSFTMIVVPALAITTATALPQGSASTAYEAQLAATGGTPPYAWSVLAEGGAPPAGVTLNTSTGRLSGTPSAAGSYSFSVRVTDSAGRTATKAFTMTVVPALAITTATALPDGPAGAPYEAQLTATGGIAPYAWTVLAEVGALPAGVALDASTGRLSGTPAAAGNYNFSVRVTDSAKGAAIKAFTLTVTNALAILTKSPLAGGTVGSVYQQQLSATGGRPPYAWSVSAGALPAGLTLNATTGIIGGTPTAAGTFDVTVAVSDGLLTVTAPYRITIGVPAAPALSITGLPDSATPATQPALGIALGDKYPLEVTGQATLTFAPDSGADDPAVQFTTGGRTASFRVPVGTTQAVFSSSTIGVQTGTVAGTITVTTRILAAGIDITSTPAPSRTIRIAKSSPVITSATVARTSNGFDLVVIGYSTPREVSLAVVGLKAASGTTLSARLFTIPLSDVFTTWYQTTASAAYGSQFSVRIPFTVQNVSNAVSSVTVFLTNSQGGSAEVGASF